MKIQLVRHATHILTYNGKKILFDPMFSEKGTLSAVLNAPNEHLKNPLSELPVEILELINVDAILVTHTHRDHFDDAAIENLPKSLPLFCQPEDAKIIQDKGFTNVIPIEEKDEWEGITFVRTPGQHGRGEIAKKMGPVSGFVMQSNLEPTLYIIGDSIWYSEIAKVFAEFLPEFAIVFAGEARFMQGDPITMGLDDIAQIIKASPNTHLIVSHMESWNHCVLSRAEVRNFVNENQLNKKILVLENGEFVNSDMISS